jgi:DnaK suppressor protein
MSKRNAERNAKGAGSAKTLAVGRKVATRSVKVSAAVASKGKPDTAPKVKAASTKRTAGKKMASRAKASSIVLPPDYRPSEDEPFMNERQRMYFRQKLLAWKEEIIRQTRETLAGLHEESTQHADLADRATSETDRALELRARDRQRKLVAKIDAALARIEDGSYGYCEETGEPIGLKRLDARPIATLSVEAQERHERRERVYRED